jgi:hypothetical protein
VIAGCGSDTSAGPNPVRTDQAAKPALLRGPAKPGEIIMRGEFTPATHGPVSLEGRYVVRFEQYAPENPRTDFRGATAFVARLDRRAEDPRGGVRIFRTAAKTGTERIDVQGRWFVDVTFGDYPYVIRFTPAGEG